MQKHVEITVGHPREIVFRTLRDNLVDIVPFMPNIKSVKVIDKDTSEQADGIIHFVNEWYGDASVPTIVKPFISSDKTHWTDYASWNEQEWTCEWRSKTAFLTDSIHASGVTTYKAIDANKTQVELDIDLGVDLSRIPGSKLIAKRAAPTIEKFVVSLMEPNLKSTFASLEQYLDDTAIPTADVG